MSFLLNNDLDALYEKGQLTYIKQFIKTEKAWHYFDLFKANFPWQQGRLNMFGKQVLTPRLECYYSDQNKDYSYSGQKLQRNDWTNELKELLGILKKEYQLKLNACLVNYYRDGQDKVGWHADDEASLGKNPTIASISLGASRTFQIKHNDKDEKHQILLEHGSLLIMKGDFQHHWKHQIPKETRVLHPRINLTFRSIKA